MADVWEKDLAQKTSLTRSDYIRVVGTDNVSYKQSIENVMRTIATYPYSYVESTGSFLDWVKATFTENGNYYVVMATDNWTGWCANSIGTCIVQKRNASWFLLAMTNETAVTDNLAIYINQTTGDSWVGWSKLPTRAEIGALNNKWVLATVSNVTIPSVNAGMTVDVTIDATKSGYVPRGLMGFAKGGGANGLLLLSQWYVNGNSLVIRFYNAHTSAVSGDTVTVNLLYEKV